MGKTTPRAKIDFQLGKWWRNATKTLGKKPNHRSIQKRIPSLRKIEKQLPTWGKNIHNKPKTNFTHRETSSCLREPQCGWLMMRKTPRSPKLWMRTHNTQNREGKNNSQASPREENEECGCMAKWACILGVNLSQKWKTFFPKFEFPTHTPLSPRK